MTHWKRREAKSPSMYERLLSHDDAEGRVHKGYVPVLVGANEDCAERSLVRVELLSDPRVAALLELAAEEFGYRQSGVLRIPCEAGYFRRVVRMISGDGCC